MLTAEQLQLKNLILSNNVQAATELARRLGPAAGDVLIETAQHEKASVRLLTLDVAVANPSPGACEAILGRLGDSNLTVRSVAGSAIGLCRSADSVPQMVEAMKQAPNPQLQSSLALSLGDAGTKEQLKDLAPLTRSSDPQLAHDAGLAMAKLGDSKQREAVILRLQSAPVGDRIQGLRDAQYLGDHALATYFGPALLDERDAFPITIPHAPQPIYARVCDLAITTMSLLRFRFTFPAEKPRRFAPQELAEARQVHAAYVRTFAGGQPQGGR